MDPIGLFPTFGHARLADFNARFIRYRQIISIVRNPWSREVSKYNNFIDHYDTNPFFQHLIKNELKMKINNFTFDHYFDLRRFFENKPFTWLHASECFFPQVEYLKNINGQIEEDKIVFPYKFV